MAGAGRGRQQDGNLVKITLSNGRPVLCAIFRGNTARLGQCVECGYFPEELYFLFCRHVLCEQCFQARNQYSCKVDKTVTKKRDATHSSLYLPLQNIVLNCPYCCDPLLYRKIKEHIETSHMEWLEQQHHLLKREVPKAHLSTSVSEESAACTRGKCVSQQAAPESSFTRQSEATPKQGEDKWQLHTTPVGYQGDASYSHRSQACGRETMEDPDTELLTDDDSSDTPLGDRDKEYGIKEEKSEEIVTCPHCITACAASELEEHEENCSSKEVNCHMCEKVITAKNYDEHMETHYRADQTRCEGAAVQEAVNGAPQSREDAKKYIENILRHKKQLGDNPSMSVEDTEKLIAELQERQKKENPGTRGIKKEDEPPTRPMPEPEGKGDPHSSGTNYKYAPPEAPVPNAEQQDEDEEMKKRREVIALKKRIKELEDRLEKLETPLKALIERL
ncbi:uncharacterized protein LOC144142793 isoform X2 [Haemaphysalis longicornis]